MKFQGFLFLDPLDAKSFHGCEGQLGALLQQASVKGW